MTSMTAPRQLLAALRLLAVLTLLTGLAYPAGVWAVGQVVAREQAAGSLVREDGRVIGSRLLGQAVTDPRLFQPRPSTSAYAGGTSGGSNLAASSAEQATAVAERRTAYAGIGGGEAAADALTASASGLDPHVTPANARAQVVRVARATGLGEATVMGLVDSHTEGRQLGFLGQPRVNVLELNLALERLRRG